MLTSVGAEQQLEVLPSFAVSISHPNMQRFDRRPFEANGWISPLFAGAGCFLGTLSAFALRELFKNEPGKLAMNLTICLGLTIVAYLVVRSIFVLNHRRKCRIPQDQKPPKEEAFYVALSYSKGLAWIDGDDWAWDKGWLYEEDSVIKFVGINTQFDLPGRLINSVKIVCTDPLRRNADSLILLEWSALEGSVQHIMLEPRDIRNPRQAVARKQELINFLLMEHERPSESGVDDPKLPFLSSKSLEAFALAGRASTISEQIVGAVAVVAVLASFAFGIRYFWPHPQELWKHLSTAMVIVLGMLTFGSSRKWLVRRRYLREGLFTEQMRSLELT